MLIICKILLLLDLPAEITYINKFCLVSHFMSMLNISSTIAMKTRLLQAKNCCLSSSRSITGMYPAGFFNMSYFSADFPKEYRHVKFKTIN